MKRTRSLRLLSLALACLLLSAPLSASAAGEAPLLRDGSVLQSGGFVLYYLSEDGQKLTPLVRQVALLPDETPAEALLKSLGQPAEGLRSPYPDGANVRLRSLEQSGSILTVDFSGDFAAVDEFVLFAMKAAVVNTLTESCGIEYVNLLFNGAELSVSDPTLGVSLPTGAMTSVAMDLETAWNQLRIEARSASRAGFTRNVTLYFLSPDGLCLLPEVRSVSFTSDDYVTPVLAELIRGPQGDLGLDRALPPSLSLLDTPVYDFSADGRRYVDVNLNYAFNSYLRQRPELRSQILGSVVCTLTTFLPSLSGVQLRVNRRYLEQDESAYSSQERLYTRSQFEALLGGAQTLYLPKADGRLSAVMRAVPLGRAGLRDLLSLLLDGPLNGEEDLLPAFPAPFTLSHVRGLCVEKDTLLFNLSDEGASLLSSLTPQEETSLIYSVVNTFTERPGIRRVLFLKEGRALRSLSGRIDLREPLLRNPALIQQTLN